MISTHRLESEFAGLPRTCGLCEALADGAVRACLLLRHTALLLIASLTACSGGSNSSPSPEWPPPAPPGASVRAQASHAEVPAAITLRAWSASSVLADSGVALEGYDLVAQVGGSHYRLTGINVSLRDCKMAGDAAIVRDGSFLSGRGYTVRVGPSTTLRIVRNKFGRDDRYGVALVTAAPGSIVEAGN
jgi:hypothetical protein